MKNFLMRGVVLVALLSFLVLPASAAFSNTDSNNISNIKAYTFDIKTALTSGTLYKNVSSIETSVKNISSSVSSIYTQIQATNNHLSTGNTNTSAIKDRIGAITNSGYRSIAEAMLTLGGKLDSSISKLTDTSNKISTFDNNVWGKLSSVVENTNVLSTSNSYLNTISSYSGTTYSNVATISSRVKTISDSLSGGGISTEAKQDTIISTMSGLATEHTNLDIAHDVDLMSSIIQQLTLVSSYKFLDSSNTWEYFGDVGALATLSNSFIYDQFEYISSGPSGDPVYTRGKTILGHLKNLSDTLASDEDKAIRDSQSENVGVVKDQFVSGSSNVGGQGSTGRSSLGKGDFEALGGFGSTGRGGFGLNGQASVDSFNSGLDDANTSGMGWFSADTKNALDNVTSSSGRSRSPARDSDPYNMSGFSDNYNWLFGGDR